jgi:hypothetical protein
MTDKLPTSPEQNPSKLPALTDDLLKATTPQERTQALAEIKTIFHANTRKGDTTLELTDFSIASGSSDHPVQESGKPGQAFGDIRVQQKNGTLSVTDEELVDGKSTKSLTVSEKNGAVTYSIHDGSLDSTTTHNPDGSVRVSTQGAGSITLYNDHRDIVFPDGTKRSDASTPALLSSFESSSFGKLEWQDGHHYTIEALANPPKS